MSLMFIVIYVAVTAIDANVRWMQHILFVQRRYQKTITCREQQFDG